MDMIFSGLYLLDYRNHTDFVKLLLYFLPKIVRFLPNEKFNKFRPESRKPNIDHHKSMMKLENLGCNLFIFFKKMCKKKRGFRN